MKWVILRDTTTELSILSICLLH